MINETTRFENPKRIKINCYLHTSGACTIETLRTPLPASDFVQANVFVQVSEGTGNRKDTGLL